MKSYEIDAGKHDFRPKDGLGLIAWNAPLLPSLKKSALVVGMVFHDNCLYNFPDGDNHDWNKLPGVSLELFSKNQNAVIGAWRSRPDLGEIEVTSYANRDGKHIVGWDEEPDRDQVFWRVKPWREVSYIVWADEPGTWNVRVFNGRAHLKPPYQQAQYKFRKKPCLFTPVGLWFGGDRPAPQRMTMEVNRAWVRKTEIRELIS